MADEYISKQRAKDLMGCCLASAKANYKNETDVFKRAKFQCYVETIEAMIDVVGAVETADVQPVKHGRWIWDSSPEFGNPYGSYVCSECDERQAHRENYCPSCGARMRIDDEDGVYE